MSVPPQGDDRLIGRVVADRYQILEVLGEGGMGRVYLAEHVRMGRKSAVKVMSPNLALSADAITRFNREAANASRINHPNVAQIYDFGETEDGVLYLAMEFVDGQTLRSNVERFGPLPPARAAALTKQIADALSAAHHLGIVHRDLKPDNIMIGHHHDGSDWVKVVDFGIAKTVQGSGDPGSGSQTVTTAGVSLGTPEYMSPEQLAGERLDSRTDLYSLGLVLFNMLTGDLPYPKVTSRETLVRRLTSKPHTLAETAPRVAWPAALQAALDRALAPDVADRYESVTDFGNDVVKAIAGFDPAATVRVEQKTARLSGPTVRVSPPPPPPATPSRSPMRASLVAVGIVLATVGGADAGYLVYRSRQHAFVPSAAAVVATAPATRAAPSATPPVAPKADSQPVAQRGAQTAGSRPAVQHVAQQAVPHLTKPAAPTPASAPRPDSTDSTPAATSTPPTAPSVTGRAFARAGGHSWLRANGDSGAARTLGPSATDADRIRLLGEEIRGHAVRANQFMQAADVPHVRSELRDLSSETQMFRLLFPAAADSIHLEMMVRNAGARLFQTCRAATADSTHHFPPNFNCQQLLAGARGGRQGQGRFNRPPL